MKTYRGYRRLGPTWEGDAMTVLCVVTVENGRHRRQLNPRLDIRNHSPTGFEWGYGGSGPAQLALALVADCAGKDYCRPAIYQRVKAKIVAAFPHDGWTLSEELLWRTILDAKSEAEAHEDARAAEEERSAEA